MSEPSSTCGTEAVQKVSHKQDGCAYPWHPSGPSSPRQNTAQKIVSRTKRTSFYQDVVFLSRAPFHTHKFTNLQRNKQTKKNTHTHTHTHTNCTTQTSCITDNSRFPPFYFSFFAQSLERRTVPEGTAIPGRCSKRMEQAPSPTSRSKNPFNM